MINLDTSGETRTKMSDESQPGLGFIARLLSALDQLTRFCRGVKENSSIELTTI